MPVYEYACKACGQHLEVAQSFKDEPLTVCPACGGALRKVFGSIGISFKGSGFYRTDSRMAARSKKDSGEKVDAKADGKAAEAKGGDTESKAGSASGEKAARAGASADSSSSKSESESKSKSKAKADAKTA